MSKVIDRLESFDLKKRVSLLILIIIIGTWAGLSAYEELDFPYEDCKSFGKRAEMGTGLCTDYGQRLFYMYHYEERYRGDNPVRIVTFELLNLSDKVFGDFRIIPFISSGFVLALTYGLTTRLTGRNYTGLIAVLFVLHSPIFWKYDLVITYPNFWVSFFLFSLWLTFYKWQLSPISYIFGLSSKVLNLLNFPAIIIFAHLTGNKASKKIMITYFVVFGGLIATVFIASMFYKPIWYQLYYIFLTQFQFQPVEFLWWLGMWAIELFTDKITLFMIFILLPCLFMLKRAKVQNSSAILAMIIIFILQPAFISGFTIYTNEDYRYLHLVVFVGIGFAFLIPNLKILVTEFQNHFAVKPKKIKK